MVELLTAVRLVCTRLPASVAALKHVVIKVDAFLLPSQWSLESASRLGFVRLLDRLLTLEWPGFNAKCREIRLKSAVQAALNDRYDVCVLEWWLKRYMPGQTALFPLHRVFEIAIQHAQLPVLDWLYQETKGELPELVLSYSCSDPEVVIWLHEHGAAKACSRLYLNCQWESDDSFQAIKRCLAYQDDQGSSLQIQRHESVVAEAIARNLLDELKWLLQHRPEFFAPTHLSYAVRCGRHEIVKWLLAAFPKLFFHDPYGTFEGHSRFGSPYKYEFEMIQWVLYDYDWANATNPNRNLWMKSAIEFAVNEGKMELLELVHKTSIIREDAAQDSSLEGKSLESVLGVSLTDLAAMRGHLEIMQWLDSHQHDGYSTKTMDMAAGNGHLEIVQWLHQHRDQGCTVDAMDSAAGFGHLSVVRWLHKNRCEGCTTRAMDTAARSGHLNVVQWLHENRDEGCTSEAMNSAVIYGRFNIVQWLYEHRTEGCLEEATELAALNGYIPMAQLLHSKCQATFSCVVLEEVASNGNFDMFKWMYEHRSKPFVPNLLAWKHRHYDSFRRILKCMALCTDQDVLGDIVDMLVETADFETVELVLATAYSRGGTSIKSSYVTLF